MNRKFTNSLLLLTAIISTSCQQNKPSDTALTEKQATKNITNNTIISGKILSTMDAGGYTYVEINTGKQTVWAAGPITSVSTGDNIEFTGRMPMDDFYSKSLSRKFETIYFVGNFTVNGSSKTPADKYSAHKSIKSKLANETKDIQLKAFSTVKGGQSISDILKNKTSLENTNIQIRGQVSKFTANVMGKNWIHIRDNSSQDDITITTDSTVKLDDIILIKGQLALNKDFGYGYIYDVIIENASINIENL